MKKKSGRREFSAAFKEAAVKRMEAGTNVTALARELKLRRKLLYAWRAARAEGRLVKPGGKPKGEGRGQPTTNDSPDRERRVAQLESLVAQLTLENRFFRGALQNIEKLRRAENAAGKPASSSRSKR